MLLHNSVIIKRHSHATARHGTWLGGMLTRKPPMLVRVALANKMARIVWCRVAFKCDNLTLKAGHPQFVWRNYPETGKFRRDSCEFEETLVAWGRSFGSKR
jgi:hypothetical protein